MKKLFLIGLLLSGSAQADVVCDRLQTLVPEMHQLANTSYSIPDFQFQLDPILLANFSPDELTLETVDRIYNLTLYIYEFRRQYTGLQMQLRFVVACSQMARGS